MGRMDESGEKGGPKRQLYGRSKEREFACSEIEKKH